MALTTGLIDSTYFEQHPCYLALDDISGETHLNNIILTYQDEILSILLGEVEKNNFINDFSGGVPQSQKWLDFLNGTTYAVNGNMVIWNGFKHLLKYFIFYFYLKDINSITVPISNVSPNFQNSQKISYANKMVEVWNIGHKYYGFDYKLLFETYYQSMMFTNVDLFRNNFNIYNRFRLTNWFDTDIEQYKPTAYNFLLNNQVDYPNWKFYQIGRLNRIGI